MVRHPHNWVAWRPDESEFGIVRERRDCSCYGDHRLGEVMGLTYMRVATVHSDDNDDLGDLVRSFESRRTH